ncbi:hypothetical protein, partial [Nocardia cyriacigeorgica]|uniref:hypothetical protein n=1 Tax=Nocardia cyriacigeorgica TaxID=135487 RepID=UPI0018955080
MGPSIPGAEVVHDLVRVLALRVGADPDATALQFADLRNQAVLDQRIRKSRSTRADDAAVSPADPADLDTSGAAPQPRRGVVAPRPAGP